MAQVTDAISGSVSYVAISTNGTDWTDVSGYSSSVQPTPQNRQSAEVWTFDGENPVLTFGKLETIDVTVRLVYSEGASSPYDTLRTQHEAAGGGTLMVRWAPAGNETGNQQFTTGSDSKIASFPFPAPDSSSPTPLLVEFTVKTKSITVADIASA